MKFFAIAVLLISSVTLASSEADGSKYGFISRDTAASFLNWSGWGGNLFNDRVAINSKASSKSVITQNCKLTYPTGVSAVPTLKDGIAYYPTWNGSFVALDYQSCTVKWQINVTDIIYKYAPVTSLQSTYITPVARSSPQIDDNGILYFGTLTHSLLIAADSKTGKVLSKIQTHPHELAILTQSPTLYKGQLVLGTSSMEVSAAAATGYPCCSFVGTIAAFTYDNKANKFTVNWNFTTLPEPIGPGGWAGGSVWGSQPAIDIKRNQVVVGTGNNYIAPASVVACLNATTQADSCLPAGAWLESVLAIDLPTGNINWGMRTNPVDSWTSACGTATSPRNFENCPDTPGVDADFGMGPAFVPGIKNKTPGGQDMLVIGQKNGNLYGISADNGTRYWATATSPGGLGGGLSWGLAADIDTAYFTAIDSGRLNYTLIPGTATTAKSSWGAAKLIDGSIQWMTAVPKNSMAYAPATLANDIVLVARTGNITAGPFPSPSTATGGLVVLNKTSGAILQQIDLDAVSYSGIAAQDKYLMMGTGYNHWGSTGSFYVFKLS